MCKFIKYISLGVFLALLFFSCKKEEKDEKKMDGLVADANKYPDPPTNSETYGNQSIDSLLSGGVWLKCTTQVVSVVKRIEDYQSFYVQNNSEIYPGAIVQGKYLKDGQVNSIGEFKRAETIIFLKNSTRSKSIFIDNPTRENLSGGVIDNDWCFYFDPPEFTYVQSVRSYTKEQSCVALGINASWLLPGLSAQLNVTNTSGTSTIFIMLKQIYYTASVGYPKKPSGFFHKKVSADDLKNVMSADNPPAYISSVSYGRMAIAKITSSYSKDEIIAALNVKFKKLGGSLTYEQASMLGSCSYEVVAAGGPSFSVWDIDKLGEYFEGGNVFTDRSGAVPIAFTANYLYDNSPFVTHTITQYTKRDCQ